MLQSQTIYKVFQKQWNSLHFHFCSKMPLLWVQLQLGNKTYKDKVSTQGCEDVADFIKAIRASPQLPTGNGIIALFEPDGNTEIDPETEMKDVLVTQGKPLVVKVDEQAKQLTEKPLISSTRHHDYKHSKAVYSSRSYLTSIAVELDKIYPITGRTTKGKRYVTIGDVFEEAYNTNPEPKPQFLNRYKRLNDFYTTDEWNLLEELNSDVNPHLHQALPVLLDGLSKEVILLINYNHLASSFQKIAKKANVVTEASQLIVKNESSVSGGSPDSDKKLFIN
jgi:hypothetical protein